MSFFLMSRYKLCVILFFNKNILFINRQKKNNTIKIKERYSSKNKVSCCIKPQTICEFCF